MKWLPDDIDLTDYMQSQEMRQKVRPASDFRADVLQRLKSDPSLTGERLPWKKTEKLIRFRAGELTLWTGINGPGKSKLLGQVAPGLMYQGAAVCIASLEMHPAETVKRMVEQAEGNGRRSERYGNQYLDWSDNRLWVYDHVGECKSDRMLALVRYCAAKLQIKHFFIDSLMKCGVKQDDYDAQSAFVSALCDICRDTGIHIHLVAHSKKQMDESRQPGKMDVKGSGTIGDLVFNIITIWRNKPKEAAHAARDYSHDGESDQVLICDKQRNGNWEGKVGLWFHPQSGQYLEECDIAPCDLMENLP